MNLKERIIALDVGDVRIGVAVSDPFGIIAQPVCFIKRIGYSKDIKSIKEIADEYKTNTLLLGLPILLSGEEGEQAKKTKQFAEELKKYGFEIIFQDERLSTKSATNILIEGNIDRKNRKTNVDKIAAAIILQQWLDKQNN